MQGRYASIVIVTQKIEEQGKARQRRRAALHLVTAPGGQTGRGPACVGERAYEFSSCLVHRAKRIRTRVVKRMQSGAARPQNNLEQKSGTTSEVCNVVVAAAK